MTSFPAQRFSRVYVIYSADVISEHTSDITRMSPESHMPAGFKDGSLRKRVREIVASRFTQTEDDDQYDYGYLGKESRPPDVRYFPYGYTDPEGIDEPAECTECFGMGTAQDAYGSHPCRECDGRGTAEAGQGQHRKWTADLSRAEWLIFADAYLIDLDENGYPREYEETMGAITEYGHLEAISYDNREGWNSGYGDPVLDSRFYISFAYPEDPNS